MGDVVQLEKFRQRVNNLSLDAMRDGLVPVEVALAEADPEACLEKLGDYGVGGVHVRSVSNYPHRELYFIGLREAIWVNRKILELEDISEEEVLQRMDLVQMMENLDFSLLDQMGEKAYSA